MAWHVQDGPGRHMVILSPELGTLRSRLPVSARSSPDLPHLPGRAKLPAASKAYCSAVTRNGCRAQTGERLEAPWGRGGRPRKLSAPLALARVPGRSLRQIQPFPHTVSPPLLHSPTGFLADVFPDHAMRKCVAPFLYLAEESGFSGVAEVGALWPALARSVVFCAVCPLGLEGVQRQGSLCVYSYGGSQTAAIVTIQRGW